MATWVIAAWQLEVWLLLGRGFILLQGCVLSYLASTITVGSRGTHASTYLSMLNMLESGLYGMPDILYLINSGSSSIVKNMQATALKKKMHSLAI